MWVLRLVPRTADRWGTAAAVFVLPTAWAALETLIIRFSPHSSGGSLAYSQMDFLPVVQIASIGGAPAIVFVVLLLAAGRVFSWRASWGSRASAVCRQHLQLSLWSWWVFWRLATPVCGRRRMPPGCRRRSSRPMGCGRRAIGRASGRFTGVRCRKRRVPVWWWSCRKRWCD
jgi:apolipoprotein N-acyltransferase